MKVNSIKFPKLLGITFNCRQPFTTPTHKSTKPQQILKALASGRDRKPSDVTGTSLEQGIIYIRYALRSTPTDIYLRKRRLVCKVSIQHRWTGRRTDSPWMSIPESPSWTLGQGTALSNSNHHPLQTKNSKCLERPVQHWRKSTYFLHIQTWLWYVQDTYVLHVMRFRTTLTATWHTL